MYRQMVSVMAVSLFAGCAASAPRLVQAPMPADIGWSPVVESSMGDESQSPPERPAGSAEKLVTFTEGSPIKVDVGVNIGLTLQFDANEYITSVRGSYEGIRPSDEKEDTWKSVIGAVGGKYPLVYLHAARPGLTTGFIILTSKRVVLLDARSVNSSRTRVVRFTSGDTIAPIHARRNLPDPLVPTMYHGGYTITPAEGGPVWTPQMVLDNGRKTFVIFPRNLRVMGYPVVRLIGANGPELVGQPLLIDHVLVLDHLVPYALELRVGTGETAEVVTITRGAATTISCPGDASCPQWPLATAQQARR